MLLIRFPPLLLHLYALGLSVKSVIHSPACPCVRHFSLHCDRITLNHFSMQTNYLKSIRPDRHWKRMAEGAREWEGVWKLRSHITWNVLWPLDMLENRTKRCIKSNQHRHWVHRVVHLFNCTAMKLNLQIYSFHAQTHNHTHTLIQHTHTRARAQHTNKMKWYTISAPYYSKLDK